MHLAPFFVGLEVFFKKYFLKLYMEILATYWHANLLLGAASPNTQRKTHPKSAPPMGVGNGRSLTG